MNQRGSAAIWTIIALVLIVSVGYVYLQKDIALSITKESATNLIVGTWQSKDDAKSVVMYNKDGSSKDVYDGEELGGGTWLVTETYDGQVTLNVLSDTEKYTYTILELDNQQMMLSYLPRGNILRYGRLTKSVKQYGDL